MAYYYVIQLLFFKSISESYSSKPSNSNPLAMQEFHNYFYTEN